MRKSAALFLDRDGVINPDKGYVGHVRDFSFVPGLRAALREAVWLGYRLVVVTNQSGIGRNFYTEQDFHALTVWMGRELRAAGVPLTAVMYCPFLAQAENATYARDSFWRKPGPGMILEAALRFGLDPARSVMVGDRIPDMQAAFAAGVGKALLLGHPDADAASLPPNVERIADIAELPAHLRTWNGTA